MITHRMLPLVLVVGLMAGCSTKPRRVSAAEFQKQFEARHVQTVYWCSYLGETNGNVYMLRKSMPLVGSKWKEEVLFAETNALAPGFLEQMRTPKEKVLEAVSWLETEAHRIIRASRREMKDGTAAFPPQVGIGYEAFWLRDYEYTLEGSITSYSDKELTDACRLFLRSMNAEGAGVDCVKYDGIPIYRPGYGSMGEHPVADGSQFTVGVAFHAYRKTKDATLLSEMLTPLVKTMGAVPRNAETGLVRIDPTRAWDRCPYGFTDTVRKQGDELFCSLLYVQACRQLSDLLLAGHREEESRKWKAEASRVAASIRKVFWDANTGLFRAATVKCREPDVWGSAFAVFLGVAEAAQSQAIARYFKTHYDQIVQHGQIRHLPGGVYWEQGGGRDEYQNGGYWATPVGWFVYTLDLADPQLADRTVLDMVNHFKKYGACEWIFGERRQLPHYLASAALPLDGIRAMLERRQQGQPRNGPNTSGQPAGSRPAS